MEMIATLILDFSQCADRCAKKDASRSASVFEEG